MCGIAGIVDLDGQPIERDILRRMGESLRHRGPDAEGIFVDAGTPAVGFVHRRLSIIDLTPRANQPIAGCDGTVRAMLNGEIYNFLSLRAQGETSHIWVSRGDTETLVHGYEDRGGAIVEDLDGMFALALWDARRRSLLLARDRFGKKPLYYAVSGRRLLFGSEIKAILAAGLATGPAGENLTEYLALGYVPTPRTFFRGILKLPPASTLVVDARGIGAPRPYWALPFPAERDVKPIDEREAVATTRDLLDAAVRKRLVADVPLGILLSGGVDSSAVAALAARAGRGAVRTFCAGFEDDTFDERPHARAVARHIGAEHHDEAVHPDAARLVETLLRHHDEPFGDSSALPTYLVAQIARRHVRVVLNGDGGDEVFAGYERFHAALLAERMPATLRSLVRWAATAVPRGLPDTNPLRRGRRFADKAERPFPDNILAWTSFADRDDLLALGGEALADATRRLSSYREVLAAVTPGTTLLSRLLHLNARTYLLDDLLPKMDRMTMAHGLEARSPFLDRDLFEYAAGLPDSFKRRGRQGKVVLKKAVAPLLPPGIVTRPKRGFGVPLDRWFRTDLRALVGDTLLDRPRLDGALRPAALRHLVEQHQAGRRNAGHQLWSLLTLELWLRHNNFDL